MDQDIQNQNKLGHVLAVSPPLQGHASPILKLSHKMTKLGMKVTFLSMDLVDAKSRDESWSQGLRIISVPSGLETGGWWKEQGKLMERIHTVLPSYVEELLSRKGRDDDERISGVIVDSTLSWMLEIPKKMGIKAAVCWCSNAGCLASGFKIPHLLQTKYIDEDGTPLKDGEAIQLLPNMPEMKASDLMWYFPSDKEMQKSMFHSIKSIFHHISAADWIIGNWFHHLDPSAAAATPKVLPLGPLLSAESTLSLRAEDSTCLAWLDAQPPRSVIYVAFGSTARFSRRQLDEIAAGLELTRRPFLWVAWSGLAEDAAPACGAEWAERVARRGKMVEWAPQEAVLGHPSTACFVSHCGWNSFTESLSNGVPVLCWPYFGDQMYIQKCACEGWKVGLRLNAGDGSGVVSRDEIKRRVDEIMEDGTVRENAMRFGGLARESVENGGTSSINLDFLLQQMKF